MDPSINNERAQEYVNSLSEVEKKAFYVARNNITNIFRMEHIVGYKDFISQKTPTQS